MQLCCIYRPYQMLLKKVNRTRCHLSKNVEQCLMISVIDIES